MKLSLLLVSGFLMLAAVAVAQQSMFYWPFGSASGSGRQMQARTYWPETRQWFQDGSKFRAPAFMVSPFRNSFPTSEDDDDAQDFYDRADEEDEVQQPEGRNQAFARRPNYHNNNLEQRNFFLRTRSATTYTTTYSTTVTATSAVVFSCIPASLFKAGSSTVPCRRRRRRQLEEEPFITPSQVEKLVPSRLASMNQILPDNERIQKREIESSFIDSSLNTASIESPVSFRSPRFFYLFSSTSTRTSTITIPTSYAFVTTTIKTSLLLGAAGALLCIPSSYQLC